MLPGQRETARVGGRVMSSIPVRMTVDTPAGLATFEIALNWYLVERRRLFGPGNDEIWGVGGWDECQRCPDASGFPCFHSTAFHR